MFKKGQVSTEYLVILAVVLVIALVVVYLVGGFAGMGAGTTETQSQQAWGTAAPFSITILKQSGTTLEMEIQNNDVDKLILTDITMDNVSVLATNTSFTSGEKKVLNATTAASCGIPGSAFSHQNVRITYTKGAIIGKTEFGIRPLMGKCS
ncbi:class III signal peptide-containing protein [Candidatus Micrarchaeota archaeon]|nr:class III signal peptide-containing protein [Candidatus Micrarchaeota archaeon]